MPTTTTETEIFAVMADNLKIAAENAAQLAWHPRRGFLYDDFRKALKLVEGACRQAFYWRDYDGRWLAIGRLCAFAHQRAGDWLRNSPSVAMRKIAQPEFSKLAEILRRMQRDTDKIRTMATGKRGPIMPVELPGPHRDTKPVQVKGLILPSGFRDKRVA